jgi:hypothetical protein
MIGKQLATSILTWLILDLHDVVYPPSQEASLEVLDEVLLVLATELASPANAFQKCPRPATAVTNHPYHAETCTSGMKHHKI